MRLTQLYAPHNFHNRDSLGKNGVHHYHHKSHFTISKFLGQIKTVKQKMPLDSKFDDLFIFAKIDDFFKILCIAFPLGDTITSLRMETKSSTRNQAHGHHELLPPCSARFGKHCNRKLIARQKIYVTITMHINYT